MKTRVVLGLLALVLATGCAGPSKLAERSEQKLSEGERFRAWQLAIRALDKEPGNARAQAAAAAAARSISQDWQRRIVALAEIDSMNAADQVVEFAEFRIAAIPYVPMPVSPEWTRQERTLRLTAAESHYRQGRESLRGERPKRAHAHFIEVERFVTGHRDAARMADRARERATTRVAFVPFQATTAHTGLGKDVADAWRGDLSRAMASARYTRIVGGDAVEREMTVAQLRRISREEAIDIGRRVGAERVVWGTIGGVDSETDVYHFRDVVARRVVTKNEDGTETVAWVDVPIDVVARVRHASVEAEYEVISVRDGSSLARRRRDHSSTARVLWTTYVPEGKIDSYALVSAPARAANPDRAREVETQWKKVAGEKTSLPQVLEARKATRGSARYSRAVLPRFVDGAPFVFLEDLPPADHLAFASLARGWTPLHEDLMRLDELDDVDVDAALVDGR